jgi:transcriptional regulator with XRE-family HTH domain
MRLNLQRGWYKGEAQKKEHLEVTAGFREMWSSNGEAEAPEQALTPQGTSPIPFLTMEQLADKANIDLGELVTIEAGQCSDPQPRTVHALAQALSLPSDKLFVVSGLKFSTDQRFNNQAVRFAARSEAVDKLNKEEQQALQEFVKYLSEK